MARPKIPTALKIAKGTLEKSRLLNEPTTEPEQDLDAPLHFNGEALKIWNKIAPELMRMQCFGKVDKEAVVAYCQNMSLYMDLYKEVVVDGAIIENRHGEKIINPCFKAAMSAHSEALRIGQMLGITASARGKINLPNKPVSKLELLQKSKIA